MALLGLVTSLHWHTSYLALVVSPSPPEVEAGRSWVRGHPQLCQEFKAILGKTLREAQKAAKCSVFLAVQRHVSPQEM